MNNEQKSTACTKCSPLWQKSGETNCWSEPGSGPGRPAHCPTNLHGATVNATVDIYAGESEDAKLARVAAQVEGLGYQPVPGSDAVNARWTRVEDTIALAKLMGYKKIGIATCIGLLDESSRLADILSAQGLDPVSVCCKTGSLDKLKLGLKDDEKVRPGTFEPACNPIAQAQVLNEQQTDMNLIVGLCVGHDMLFAKHSKAPVSTLIAKDRVTGHNPAAVLYGQNFYYKRLQKQPVINPDDLPQQGS